MIVEFETMESRKRYIIVYLPVVELLFLPADFVIRLPFSGLFLTTNS